MRKLAHIEYIHHIDPIENADNIELVKVLGWQCVAKKGEFRVGDLAVYFEIDSFLPIKDERYEFLRNSCYKNSDLLGEGYKLKTQKMRGELSQGLCLPLSMFPEITDPQIGDDVTELLEVRKWEVAEPASTQGTNIGYLPHFIHKTEEPRIQNIPDIIYQYMSSEFYITTKLDGSSFSVGIIKDKGADKGYTFHVCGSNYEYADDGKCSFWQIVKEKDLESKLWEMLRITGRQSIVVQGEYCASGIQGNPLKLQRHNWYIFNVEIDGERQGLHAAKNCAEELNLEFVPVEEKNVCIRDFYPTLESILLRAEGTYDSGAIKEGIVVRRVKDGKLSFKAINNQYLLKKHSR